MYRFVRVSNSHKFAVRCAYLVHRFMSVYIPSTPNGREKEVIESWQSLASTEALRMSSIKSAFFLEADVLAEARRRLSRCYYFQQSAGETRISLVHQASVAGMLISMSAMAVITFAAVSQATPLLSAVLAASYAITYLWWDTVVGSVCAVFLGGALQASGVKGSRMIAMWCLTVSNRALYGPSFISVWVCILFLGACEALLCLWYDDQCWCPMQFQGHLRNCQEQKQQQRRWQMWSKLRNVYFSPLAGKNTGCWQGQRERKEKEEEGNAEGLCSLLVQQKGRRVRPGLGKRLVCALAAAPFFAVLELLVGCGYKPWVLHGPLEVNLESREDVPIDVESERTPSVLEDEQQGPEWAGQCGGSGFGETAVERMDHDRGNRKGSGEAEAMPLIETE